MRVALLAALLLALTVPAFADVITVPGTLAGDAMPDGYKFELAVVAIHTDGVVIEVVGKNCSSFADTRSCQRQTINFSLPAGAIVVQGNKAFFKQGDKQLMIGNVASLGTTHWINLKKGATLVATVKEAKITLDTGLLGRLSREDRFVLLFGF